MKYNNCVIGLTATSIIFLSQFAAAEGFLEDSHLNLKLRNFYMNRNFLDDRTSQNYSEAWAQGFISTFESGYTTGIVGVGVDAIGLLGVRLDTGGGREGGGTMLLDTDSDGSKGEYSKGAAALKLKVSKTTLKYGGQIVNVPVLSTTDNRLLPETTEGMLLTSQELPGLTLHAGHFTALSLRDDSSRDRQKMTSVDFAGGSYQLTPSISVRAYHSEVADYWKKNYVGATAIHKLNDNKLFKLDFNGYQTHSEGAERGGDLDNRIWSLAASFQTGMHTFMIARQQVSGTGKYTYGPDGNSTIFLANSVQYSDFNYENERSWQIRYDLDFAPLGVPGLTFMTRYLRGTDFHTPETDNGRAWERDIEARYVVQSGAAKNLSFRVRQASFRSPDRGLNFNEVRLITEYPIDIF